MNKIPLTFWQNCSIDIKSNKLVSSSCLVSLIASCVSQKKYYQIPHGLMPMSTWFSKYLLIYCISQRNEWVQYDTIDSREPYLTLMSLDCRILPRINMELINSFFNSILVSIIKINAFSNITDIVPLFSIITQLPMAIQSIRFVLWDKVSPTASYSHKISLSIMNIILENCLCYFSLCFCFSPVVILLDREYKSQIWIKISCFSI